MYSVDESLTPNDYTHLKITSGLSNFRGRIKMTANNSTSSGIPDQWLLEAPVSDAGHQLWRAGETDTRG